MTMQFRSCSRLPPHVRDEIELIAKNFRNIDRSRRPLIPNKPDIFERERVLFQGNAWRIRAVKGLNNSVRLIAIWFNPKASDWCDHRYDCTGGWNIDVIADFIRELLEQ